MLQFGGCQDIKTFEVAILIGELPVNVTRCIDLLCDIAKSYLNICVITTPAILFAVLAASGFSDTCAVTMAPSKINAS